MMNVTKPAADRIEVELSGTLDTDGMGKALDDLIDQSHGMTHGRMLYRFLISKCRRWVRSAQKLPRCRDC